MDDLVSQSYIYQTPLVHDSPVTRTQSSIENLVPETNPNAPAWTPGLCSSGERSGDNPDRNGTVAHCVGMHHKREGGVESDGVGRLNLPVNQDKHRADKFSQRVRTAISR